MAVPGCECERCIGKRSVEAPKPQTLSQLVTLQREQIATLKRRLAALEARVGTGAEP